jgi:hypothetical protein
MVSFGHNEMRALLFAQVGLGLGIEGLGALAIAFSLVVGACVMGGLGFASVFAKPPRPIEGVVVGGISVVMWISECVFAYAFGLAWRSSTMLLIHAVCGVIAVVPVVMGGRMIRRAAASK